MGHRASGSGRSALRRGRCRRPSGVGRRGDGGQPYAGRRRRLGPEGPAAPAGRRPGELPGVADRQRGTLSVPADRDRPLAGVRRLRRLPGGRLRRDRPDVGGLSFPNGHRRLRGGGHPGVPGAGVGVRAVRLGRQVDPDDIRAGAGPACQRLGPHLRIRGDANGAPQVRASRGRRDPARGDYAAGQPLRPGGRGVRAALQRTPRGGTRSPTPTPSPTAAERLASPGPSATGSTTFES